jgi:hypothetical protein
VPKKPNPPRHLFYVPGTFCVLDQSNLDASASDYFRSISSATTTALMFCADTLCIANQTAGLESSQIASMLESIDDLIAKVSDTDLDPGFKRALLRGLMEIRNALKMYEIVGPEGVKEAAENAIGSVIVMQNRVETATETEETKEVSAKFLSILNHVLSVTTSVLNITNLAVPELVKLLPAG